MADSRSNYSLTTFNSSGELVQIKHALAAVQSGATSLGIRAVNGVVLATEKKLPSTLVGGGHADPPARIGRLPACGCFFVVSNPPSASPRSETITSPSPQRCGAWSSAQSVPRE